MLEVYERGVCGLGGFVAGHVVAQHDTAHLVPRGEVVAVFHHFIGDLDGAGKYFVELVGDLVVDLQRVISVEPAEKSTGEVAADRQCEEQEREKYARADGGYAVAARQLYDRGDNGRDRDDPAEDFPVGCVAVAPPKDLTAVHFTLYRFCSLRNSVEDSLALR